MHVNVIKHADSHFSLDFMRNALSDIEKLAKALGVDRTLLEGRTGWSKVFPDYKVEKTILYKNLTGGNDEHS